MAEPMKSSTHLSWSASGSCMTPMKRILSSLLVFLGVTGCQQSVQEDALSIKDLIESYKDAPLGESIKEVSRHLAQCEIILPTEGAYQAGEPLRLKTASDNEGRDWVYAYTDESEVLAAFPQGSDFVAMPFRDAFGIVARDARFGGISINRTEKYLYLIPREVFDMVQAELDAIPQASNLNR